MSRSLLFLNKRDKKLATRERNTVRISRQILPVSQLFYPTTYSEEYLLLFELLLGILAVIDEGETSGSATTELVLEAHNSDGLLLTFEGGSKFLLDLILWHISHTGVDQVNSLQSIKESDKLTSCFLARRGFFKNLRT